MKDLHLAALGLAWTKSHVLIFCLRDSQFMHNILPSRWRLSIIIIYYYILLYYIIYDLLSIISSKFYLLIAFFTSYIGNLTHLEINEFECEQWPLKAAQNDTQTASRGILYVLAFRSKHLFKRELMTRMLYLCYCCHRASLSDIRDW